MNVALLGWTVFDVPFVTLFSEASLCEFDGSTSFNVAVDLFFSWFFVELSTSLRLSPVICLCTGGQGDLNASRIIKIMRLLKIARFIKFLKILKRWQKLATSSFSSVLT